MPPEPASLTNGELVTAVRQLTDDIREDNRAKELLRKQIEEANRK